MKKICSVFLAFISLAVAGFSAEQKILFIPLAPFDQKLSEKMRQQISALEAEGTLSALSNWKTMAVLPAWVFVEKKREITYIFGRSGVSDDYRYAVILGRKRELIIVRAGGFAGVVRDFCEAEGAQPGANAHNCHVSCCCTPRASHARGSRVMSRQKHDRRNCCG